MYLCTCNKKNSFVKHDPVLRCADVEIVHNNSCYTSANQHNATMHTDRGLQAAVGVVVAFSILWTFAILLLDDSSSSSTASVRQYKRDGLVVDGNHYVLDSNFLIDQVSSDQDYKVIHAVKVKPPKNIMRVSTISDS